MLAEDSIVDEVHAPVEIDITGQRVTKEKRIGVNSFP